MDSIMVTQRDTRQLIRWYDIQFLSTGIANPNGRLNQTSAHHYTSIIRVLLLLED